MGWSGAVCHLQNGHPLKRKREKPYRLSGVRRPCRRLWFVRKTVSQTAGHSVLAGLAASGCRWTARMHELTRRTEMARRILVLAGACALLAMVAADADAGWRRCCRGGHRYGYVGGYGYSAGYGGVGYSAGYGAGVYGAGAGINTGVGVNGAAAGAGVNAGAGTYGAGAGVNAGAGVATPAPAPAPAAPEAPPAPTAPNP